VYNVVTSACGGAFIMLTESDKVILWKLKSILKPHINYLEHYNNDSHQVFGDKLRLLYEDYKGFIELFQYQDISNHLSDDLSSCTRVFNRDCELVWDDPGFLKNNFSIYLAFSNIFKSAKENFSLFDSWFTTINELTVNTKESEAK